MKAEIAMLVGALGLAVVQVMVAVFGAYRQVGLTVLAGNRENMPYILGWAGRAERAQRNMLESLVLFAPLVLAAHVSGVSNPITILGAYVYLWGRVAYAFLYVAGIPWARSGAWLLSLWGMVMIATQLI
jgi:uncharacterized MAPEG superfamily protein